MRTKEADGTARITARMRGLLFGQDAAIDRIMEYVQVANVALVPDNRPSAVFMLMGPTGTGKTKTVEALADAIHGSSRNLLRIDCGEFQMEHEVAKLIGAPPGYLGHRETSPQLTQQKLNSIRSDQSSLSIVLFDEIEKAAPSFQRIMLGILDKASLKLGDGGAVDFQRTLIFMTSNVAASEMQRALIPDFGFDALSPMQRNQDEIQRKCHDIGMAALRRKFSPEFVNRIDAVVTYQTLDRAAHEHILDAEIIALEKLICERSGGEFGYEVEASACEYLLAKGIDKTYGARELKRVLFRELLVPTARFLECGRLERGGGVIVQLNNTGDGLTLLPEDIRRKKAA